MSDGNVQAAKTRMGRAVDALCKPRLAVYHTGTYEAPSCMTAFAAIWPARKGTRNGRLYRRAEPALPTDASEFSLLPTPVSSDATRGPHWNNRTVTEWETDNE